MTNPSKREKQRRPRLSAPIRLRIVQLRASEEQPPTIDAILDKLEEEEFEPLPSRSSVYNVIHQWELLPDEVRVRDLSFSWHQMERAGLPWEASEWLLECDFVRKAEIMRLVDAADPIAVAPAAFVAEALGRRWPFTNRCAAWSWRVHLAAPDMRIGLAMAIAYAYAEEERARDLLPDRPSMNVDGYDDYLTFRPDQAEREGKENAGVIYEAMKQLGLSKPTPGIMADRDRQQKLSDLPGASESSVVLGMAVAREIALNKWKEQVYSSEEVAK